MDLQMDVGNASAYSSNFQKIRVITEQWVGNNLFCPYCGSGYINHFENNRPVDMTIPEKPQSSKQKYVKHTKR